VFVADLPETVGGKVLKYKLRAEHAAHYAAGLSRGQRPLSRPWACPGEGRRARWVNNGALRL
jgi:hypothetical protein